MKAHDFEYQAAYAEVSEVFEDEWPDLSQSQIGLVVADLMLAQREDGVTASQYAKRIGDGNLTAYVKCLEVSR